MNQNKLQKVVLSVLVLLPWHFASLQASQSESAHRPFEEMKGDCKNFALNLGKELTSWANDPQELKGVSNLSSDTPMLLPMNKRVNIALAKESEVQWMQKPKKTFKKSGARYGGMVPFLTAKKGVYRLSAGDKVWIDVIDFQTKKVVRSTRFEMQTQCDQIFKVVEYEFAANSKYVLQVSSSDKQSQSFLLSRSL